MNYEPHEPNAPVARPCSIPHSAPVAWLRTCPEPAEGHDPGDPSQPETESCLSEVEGPSLDLDSVAAHLRSNPEALADFIERISPDQQRADGWSPFLRKLFLQVLAETGRVGTACEYTGLSRQSAYALRARDPLSAAGWDAACELARAPLADALYEKALDGVTDTVTRDGAAVATRHRFDSRLSIAVLNRLDKRCDRAEERGSKHLALVAHWDEWLTLVGKGAEAEAAAFLEPAPAEPSNQCQTCQLAESENPTQDEGLDLTDRYWRDAIDDVWMTDFPPPPGFSGYESRPYDEKDGDELYTRACTAEEAELLDADEAASQAAERAEDEQLRDAWFEMLREELAATAETQMPDVEQPDAQGEASL